MSNNLKIPFVILLILSTIGPVAADPYDEYNNFAKSHFGAENDSLVYNFSGSNLKFYENWTFVSENSSALAFETNLPTLTYISYGATKNLSRTSHVEDRPYYLHLHHLSDLRGSHLYYYRITATDERGNSISSPILNFTTIRYNNPLHIPNDVAGPPYTLDQQDRIYVLTQNISSDTRGFTIKARNVTLDFNGYTLTYDNGSPMLENTSWDKYVYSDNSTMGVFGIYNIGDSRVLNGRIIQGSNNGAGNIGIGFNPIYLTTTKGNELEIAGMEVEYSGDDVGGICARYGDTYVHHNIVTDRGTQVTNRHQGIRAIYGSTSSLRPYHHNLIRRSRHQGITYAESTISNEIHIDSYATNSFGVAYSRDIQRNRIFGTGYMVMAISWTTNMSVKGNLVRLFGTNVSNRSNEYGDACSMTGIRLTQYGGSTELYENNLYEDNMVIVYGEDGCPTLRGIEVSSDPFVRNVTVINNTFKVIALDNLSGSDVGACIVGQGLSTRANRQLPVYYINNRLISNIGNVRFGDSYCSGGNHRLINCTFERVPGNRNYNTIYVGYWKLNTSNNTIIDPTFKGGADINNYTFSGTAIKDFSVGKRIYIKAYGLNNKTVRYSNVLLKDDYGDEFNSTIINGTIALEALNYTIIGDASSQTKILRTNHTLYIQGYKPIPINYFTISSRSSPLTINLVFDNATCFNGRKDPTEDQTDCGGGCHPCCIHQSDLAPCDGRISFGELKKFQKEWRSGIADLNMIIEAIKLWRSS